MDCGHLNRQPVSAHTSETLEDLRPWILAANAERAQPHTTQSALSRTL